MERPLSAVERRMFLLSRGGIGNGVMRARIRGPLDEARIRGAIDKLRRRHPLLSARVVCRQGQLTFTTDEATPFPFRVVSDDGSGDTWRAVAAAEKITPFDPATGPLYRVVMINQPGGERADLVMTLYHAAGDGFSMLSVLRDLLTFAALPDTAVEPLPPLPPLAAMLPATGAPPSLPASPLEAHPPLPPVRSALPSDIAITTEQIPPGRMQALARHCKEQGVTVHAAFCAAMTPPLTALFAGKSTLTISSPASYRKHLRHPHADRALGNFIRFVDVSVALSTPRRFWERARGIYRQLSEETAADALSRPVSVFEAVSRAEPDDDAFLARTDLLMGNPDDISISNLGRQPLPTRYGALTIEAIHAGSCLPGELVLFLTTLDDTMHITLMSNRLSATTNDDARRALASALEDITAHTVDIEP